MVYLHKKSLAITSFWKDIQLNMVLDVNSEKTSNVHAHAKAFLAQSLYSVG